MMRFCPIAIAIAASFDATALATETTIAVLVETTAGGASLASTLELSLEGPGIRVVSVKETRAAMEYLELERPLNDWTAARFRKELGVDRIVIVSDQLSRDGTPGVRVRFVDASGVVPRSSPVTVETFDDEVQRLMREAPPLPEHVDAPHRSPAGTSAAAPIWSAPPPRPPSTFGKRSTWELGASVGFYDGRSTAQFDDIEGSRSTSRLTRASLRPVIGYFPFGSVELLGMGSYVISARKGADVLDDSYQRYGGSVGIAVLPLVAGGLRVGPQVTGGVVRSRQAYRYLDEEEDIRSADIQEEGTRGTLGVVVKIPLGRSAVMTVDAHYFSEVVGVREGGSRGTGRISGADVTIGFSYWRRRETR